MAVVGRYEAATYRPERAKRRWRTWAIGLTRPLIQPSRWACRTRLTNSERMLATVGAASAGDGVVDPPENAPGRRSA